MTLLGIEGSGRAGSYNRQLLDAFLAQAQAIGLPGNVPIVSPSSHRVPNLVPDLERSVEEVAACDDVRALAMRADAVVIASPEYNGGPTGGLKNLIDWMTRPNTAHPKGNPFVMKPVVLLAASPGALGGIKGLQVLRLIMGHLRALVLPEQVAVPHCESAFDTQGRLKPGLSAQLCQAAVAQLAQVMKPDT